MSEVIYPSNRLTVVIRDDSPMVFCGDSPTYRSITIELTESQVQQLVLHRTGKSGTQEYHEAISRCFIEPRVC